MVPISADADTDDTTSPDTGDPDGSDVGASTKEPASHKRVHL